MCGPVDSRRCPRPPPSDTDTVPGTRWDIQGLRAFAVLAVVLYHLWPNRLPGGFVGVDVFFVISGYLITGHLLREQIRSGRVELGSFWARRARRLLPGAFLTIVVTGVVVLLVVPSSLWGQYGRELIASTVYLQNWQLASDAVDYLASDNQPSPFQHFWSLSVEEQFYIALPLLLLVAGWVLRRTRGASPVRTARLLLGVVAVASLVWCVVETRTGPGIAYFSTATRAWEFALGGLVATVPLALADTPRVRLVRTGGAWLGVAGLVASVVVITPATPFPGTAALLPVLSAALVVTAGGSQRPRGARSAGARRVHRPDLVRRLPVALARRRRPADGARTPARHAEQAPGARRFVRPRRRDDARRRGAAAVLGPGPTAAAPPRGPVRARRHRRRRRPRRGDPHRAPGPAAAGRGVRGAARARRRALLRRRRPDRLVGPLRRPAARRRPCPGARCGSRATTRTAVRAGRTAPRTSTSARSGRRRGTADTSSRWATRTTTR
ncbi:acyltransferase [Curtobacterium sp. MCJR17_043]|uniref:acyltransferase family protein n=1 Tax=Curtobacterium sp. MCJR17_043 TaxID=2175660 RepID=UPI0024DFD0C3|nr:acyltransferase [Curtobacterium sp. MCJR17_043]WIB35263.1 acyltransferase [Curtobacterium sp. MCJR17_043]